MTPERVAKSYTFEKMHFPDKAYSIQNQSLKQENEKSNTDSVVKANDVLTQKLWKVRYRYLHR